MQIAPGFKITLSIHVKFRNTPVMLAKVDCTHCKFAQQPVARENILSDLTRTNHFVFGGGQRLKAEGAACVKLLG